MLAGLCVVTFGAAVTASLPFASRLLSRGHRIGAAGCVATGASIGAGLVLAGLWPLWGQR